MNADDLELLQDRLIVQGIVGSTAYGLAGPNSDIDRLGVFVAPGPDVLGLDGPSAVTQSIVKQDPDRTYHEIGKYLSLALKCNPTVMDLMWLQSHEYVTEEGAAMLLLRNAVLSTKYVRSAYSGYAMQQAERLVRRNAEGKAGFDPDTGNRTQKHARHCWRLILAAESALTTGVVMVDATEHREEIFRAGESAEENPKVFRDIVEDKVRAIHSMPSILPDLPNRELVDQTLIRIRRTFP